MSINTSSILPQAGIFPDGRLHHLVNAATMQGDVSSEWQAYVTALDQDYPNEGEMRLYPLIADRLGALDGDTPLRNYVQSAQRWARMQAMINRRLAGQIGQIFHTENIPMMWTKGIALVERTDQRMDVRPSSDLDVIIHWEDTERVLDLGQRQDWKIRLGLHGNKKHARTNNPEISFDIGQAGMLDLQWNPRMPFAFDPTLLHWLWQDQDPAQDQNGIHIACDTWLLIETIEHGVNINTVHPIRWVVDAVRLLEHRHNSIDWQKFVEFTIRYKLHYTFKIGLDWVARYSDHIPQWVLDALGNAPVSFLDKEEYRVRVTAPDLISGYYALRSLNSLRRKPSRQYYKSPPRPLQKNVSLSFKVRLAIAGRNLYTRLLFPLWYLKT